MIYPEIFEQKIGFDKIRLLIKNHCLSPLGEEKAAEMTFSSDFIFIRKQLYRTHEFTRIIQEENSFPSDYFFDVRDALKKIRVEGTYLTEKELFDIRRSLETINEIVRFFKPDGDYPYLQELASGVASFPHLTKQIDTILDKFGKIRDNASPALADIRRQLTLTANGISKTLQGILRTAQSENLVDKDLTPTMRDGRLMIPVSSAFKRKIKGIVHDESATGKTVFIEPAEVVEANNKIRELESDEKREIIRILTTFTNQIRPEIPEIFNSYRFLAEIDFIRAKALFASDIEAILPAFEDVRQMDWIRAVHPLLYLSHKKQNKPVVPLDMELTLAPRLFTPQPPSGDLGVSDSGVILLVSGPNAGGKSVLLKTVGLLQYMLQSGLLIPVDERSKTGIFKDIFLDIGDEQSIENDLSTYSSHLFNMKFMLRNAGSKSLILIDEFGGGTEPNIGGAIAEALLHRFNEKGCWGVITTHYHNLKLYADDHEGIINGAMLYDRHLMQPLFQLSVGQPGSSFAIEIARKIGLSEDVIAEASEKVGQDYVSMDKYLQDIVRDKRYWESKRQQIRRQEKQLEELSGRYQSDLEKLELRKKEWLAKAKTDAEHLLSEANAKIENTIREIKEAQAEKEKTKTIRKDLEEFRQRIRNEESKVQSEKQKVKPPKAKTERQKAKDEKEISIGDSVRIKGQQTVGTVIDRKDDFFVAAFGAIKTAVRAGQLEKVQNTEQTAKNSISNLSSVIAQPSPFSVLSEKKLNFKPEIDIRGMRANEALQAVTYYVDDAVQCNAGRVRILHGTGTGALRQIIRDYLRTASGVKRFQDEHVQFGGAGITVVELE
ncbi:MAG: Smr/MutS family protein [Dysgonamonadaceae bacterium]|jgi:DNA mismatch repair protein MutS2|nr:Smr/MutS family protein [Dysgonamonadaceae bacterium]